MTLPLPHPSPFSHSRLLPLRSVNTIATNVVLVVAPHPDDETLGCGGAITLLRAMNCPVYVLVISDGTRSHPRSLKYPAPRLRELRQAETLEALAILGVSAAETTFLHLPDGAVPGLESSQAQAAIGRCRTYLQTIRPETVFLPWRADPHPDHRATWQLIHTALTDLGFTPRMIEYPIWDWDATQRGDFTDYSQVMGWRLDISNVLETKLQAIGAYRSQTTDLIDDDPEGFRLTAAMLENFARSWELYLEEI